MAVVVMFSIAATGAAVASGEPYGWSKPIAIAPGNLSMPEISTYGELVTTAWDKLVDCQYASGTPEVVVRRSTDGGATFGPVEFVSARANNLAEHSPSIAATDLGPVMAWSRSPSPGCAIGTPSELVMAYDHGDGWTRVVPEQSPELTSYWGGQMAASGLRAYYVGGEPRASILRTLDAGKTWNRVGEVGQHPAVAAVGSTAVVVWQDWRDGGVQPELYARTTADDGASWSGDVRLTNTSAREFPASVAIEGNTVVATWVKQLSSTSAQLLTSTSQDAGGSWNQPTVIASLDDYYRWWVEQSARPLITVSASGFEIFAHRTPANSTLRFVSQDGLQWSAATPPGKGHGTGYGEVVRLAASGPTLHAISRTKFSDSNNYGYLQWGIINEAPVNPTLKSSHTAREWSRDRTVTVTWPGVNAVGGAADTSGVDGYSVLWDTNATSVPDADTTTDAAGKWLQETATTTTSPPLTDGKTHYFHLRTRDNAGNWSTPIHLGPFFIDRNGPLWPSGALSALPAFSLQRDATLSWAAATDEHARGITYQLQQRTGAHTRAYDDPATDSVERLPIAANWSNVAGTSTLRQRTLTQALGTMNCFRVKATDAAGNLAYSNTRCTSVPVNDSSLSRTTGWTYESANGLFYDRALSRSSTSGTALTLGDVRGAKRIGLVVTRCYGCGTAEVRWNGVAMRSGTTTTLNLASSTTRSKQLITMNSLPTNQDGTLTVRVTSRNKPVKIEGVAISK